MDTSIQQHRFTRNELHRIRQLKNNVLDLGIAIDDIDVEIATRLVKRAELEILLLQAQAELGPLVRRAA